MRIHVASQTFNYLTSLHVLFFWGFVVVNDFDEIMVFIVFDN